MKQKKQKGLSLIIITFVFAALVSFGYFVYQKQKITLKTSPSVQTSPIDNAATNLQTYTDTQNRFSFKYPKEWKVDSANDSINIFNESSHIRIQLSPYPSIDFERLYEKTNGAVDQNPVSIRTKIKNLDIDGYKATMYTNESTPTNQNKSFDIFLYFDKSSSITMISAQTSPSSKDNLLSTFDQFVSTLEFKN